MCSSVYANSLSVHYTLFIQMLWQAAGKYSHSVMKYFNDIYPHWWRHDYSRAVPRDVCYLAWIQRDGDSKHDYTSTIIMLISFMLLGKWIIFHFTCLVYTKASLNRNKRNNSSNTACYGWWQWGDSVLIWFRLLFLRIWLTHFNLFQSFFSDQVFQVSFTTGFN